MPDELLDCADEELGAAGAQERDWKGIATALIVIMLICVLIGCALVLFTPLTASSHVLSRRLNLSDLARLRSNIYGVPRYVDTRTVLAESRRGFEIIRTDKPEQRQIVVERESVSMELSHDRRYYAAYHRAPNHGMNMENLTYYIKLVNIETRMSTDVSKTKTPQQAFHWNPTGNDYVYVEDGEVFYTASPESTEAVRVSDGGRREFVIHGIFEWLYMEEIYGRSKRSALWWSPSGEQLAYASYDNHLTRNITVQWFHQFESYTTDTQVGYPKTFEKRLPIYTISIWNKAKKETKHMDVQLRDSLVYHYLFAVEWVRLHDKEHLVTVWADRYQRRISINICHFDTGICDLTFEYEYGNKHWASPEDFTPIMAFKDSLFLLLPHETQANNGYQHVARLSISKSGAMAKPVFLPAGDFDVTSISAIDEDNEQIYYVAAAPNPGQRHVYATKTTAKSSDAYECVTCDVDNCTFQKVELAPDFGQATIYCRGPGAPTLVVLDLKQHKTSDKAKWWKLFNDTDYQKKVEEAGVPTMSWESVPLSGDYEARVRLFLPKDLLAKEKSRSIPLLVQVYGGPNSQMTSEEFSMDFVQVLSSNQHIAVANIDGRGTGPRGWKYRSSIYGGLGTVEPQDQLEAIREILTRHPYLDPNRVAVFGWSYGGFMSLSMVEVAPSRFFKCAISVAPVTNFIYYDATYTERYMGAANSAAYEAVDVTRDVSKFRSTKLLLMHGLFDENVHFQNSALLIEQLQVQNIDFDLMVYPNQAHGISDRKTHLNTKMMNFLHQCFFPQ